MPNCPHTDFRKGQRIVIIFNDGNKVVDKFVENKSGVIITETLGRTKIKDIRSTSIYRGDNI